MSDKEPTLRKSAQQAILWSAGLNLFRDLLQFGQMLILVRLLDPDIYGMAGLATTLINFIGIISFQHVIPHVLQLRGDTQVNYHQHFTAGAALNGLLFVFANAVAFGLQYTTQYYHLQPLVHMLSLTFLMSVPVDMRVKMLERDHNWSRLRILQMVGIVISVVAGIGMALSGAGVYALIVPGLLASLVFLLDLFLFCRWWPRWQWNYVSYRDALHFGFSRAGSSALNGGRYLLQNTLITHHFQFSTLGIFGRAENLANMFCGRIAQEVTGALYPIITRAEAHSHRFQRISGLVLQSVAWVVIPIAAFFSLEAENIVTTLFGSKWLEVIPLLPPAMAIGVTVSIGATAYRLLLANNQSRLCLRSDMAAFAMAAVTAPVAALLSYFGFCSSYLKLNLLAVVLGLIAFFAASAAVSHLRSLLGRLDALPRWSISGVCRRYYSAAFTEFKSNEAEFIEVCQHFAEPVLKDYPPGSKRVADLLRAWRALRERIVAEDAGFAVSDVVVDEIPRPGGRAVDVVVRLYGDRGEKATFRNVALCADERWFLATPEPLIVEDA